LRIEELAGRTSAIPGIVTSIRRAADFESPPGMFRIRVNRANDHAFDSRRADGIGAGRCAAVRATRFERYEKRRARGL